MHGTPLPGARCHGSMTPMRTPHLTLGSFTLAFALFAAAGCGGDTTTTPADLGAIGNPLTCLAYCDAVMANCTGANSQYADMAACMTDCKTFKPDAASYSTADTATNDFGCRMYHLSVAATDSGSADTHCGHIKSTSPVCVN